MDTKKIIALVITIFVMSPIWIFLTYTVLKAIQVDRLVWFLFWIYAPLSIFVQILLKIAEDD